MSRKHLPPCSCWGVINVKPFENWNFGESPRGKPNPSAWSGPSGTSGAPWDFWGPGAPPGPQAGLCRLFQYSWGSSVLLGIDCYSLLAPEHWLNTVRKREDPCWIISFGPEEWPGEHILAYVLPSKFFQILFVRLQNKFLAVEKKIYRSLYRN